MGTNPRLDSGVRTQVPLCFVLLSSSAVTYAFATFPCIGRLAERLELPFFWIDAFACTALYPWHTSKSVSREVNPKSSEFSPKHYATLVAYPASFHKNGFAVLIRTADPTKVRIGERQRDEDEPKLLKTTVGRVVPLLPVAPDRSSGKLEASVNKLFDEGGSDVAPAQLNRQKKRKTKVADAGEPSHPANKLRDDYGAPGGPPVGEKLVGSSLFGVDSPSAGGSHPIPGGFSDCIGSDFLIGGIRTVIDPDSNLQKVYVPQWNVTNGSCLDDGDVCHETVDEFAPSKFFASVCGMEHEQLFTEFNVGAARQMSLSVEVRMRTEYNIRERRRLNSIVEEKDALLKSKDEEIESLKAQFVLKEAEAAEAIRLRAEASNFQAVEQSLQSEMAALKEDNNLPEIEKSGLDVIVADLAASVKVRDQEVADLDVVVTLLSYKMTILLISQLEKFQDDRMREMNDKFDKLNTDLVEMALHLVERFYPHLLTTISEHRWLLTHGLELAIAKCLNSSEYLSTLGAAIGKAVEKGMQDRLSTKITHGAEGRVLTDVAAYNPSTEADYLAALQRLQSSAEKLGLTKSQPHVDQLMVPIHHSPNQRVVGASALSLSVDVSSSRVWMIKENIAKHRSALHDVFVPLTEPLSVTALTGTKSTLNVIPATVDTTTALSVTLISASLIPLISTDDYEVVHAEGGDSAGADVNPFSNVDDAELNIPQ
uniref:Transposase (Putative), gypsy type n=1 Tax=Tanacetum cinerariifolium TaxID=118510 RepID=A0A699HRJ3_TANCI|nr:hypothetical protein [Tanacetum cinerariifolium]